MKFLLYSTLGLLKVFYGYLNSIIAFAMIIPNEVV